MTLARVLVTASKIPGGLIPNRRVCTKPFHLTVKVISTTGKSDKSLSAKVGMSTVKTKLV